MAPSWLPLAPLWLPLAPSGSLWLLTDSIGPIKQLECMVTFRYLWPHNHDPCHGGGGPKETIANFKFWGWRVVGSIP